MRQKRAVKIITLRRFLDQAGGPGGCPMPCVAFAGVLSEELASGGAPVELETLRADAGQRQEFFGDLAERLRLRREEEARRQEEMRREMQRLVAAFHQAVMALADGGERAAGRFAAVQAKLERATRAESLAAMRAAVYEAAEALKREGEAQRAETASQVEALGRRLEEARERRAACVESRTSGREAGVRALREAVARGSGLAVAGVVFDRLPMMESRFGRAVAQEALEAFEQERVLPTGCVGPVYAWTPQMRVWLVEAGGDGEAVRDRLNAALGEPFEYRTVAGGRVVTLLVEGRWMWGLLGRTDEETLIEEVDLFAAGAPSRR